MVHCKAFDIITWPPPSPSIGYPLFNTWDVMMNPVVLRPGNLHQYPVLSCGKHLYDYHITKNFSDGDVFILSYYFLRKKNIVQSCLYQFINDIICFFLQNGWGNTIQVWIELHKDIYGNVTGFPTCCTSTVWQRVSSQLFAENIEEWNRSSFRPSDEETYHTTSMEFVVP